jgi:hypothetical protein
VRGGWPAGINGVNAACAEGIMIVIIEEGKENSSARTLKYFHSICLKARNTPTEKAMN